VGVFVGYVDETTKQYRIYAPDLHRTIRSSIGDIDEDTPGGAIDLRLRIPTKTGALPERNPRGRPKKQPSRDAINTAGIGRDALSQPEAAVDSPTPNESEAPESVGARGLNQPTADDPDSDYMTCDEDHGSTGRTGPISQD
jgi:hypothetical protein